MFVSIKRGGGISLDEDSFERVLVHMREQCRSRRVHRLIFQYVRHIDKSEIETLRF